MLRALAIGAIAAAAVFPPLIELPKGFQPEGIEIGKGTTFYVGSRATGAIVRGDLRTGEQELLVSSSARRATGIELDEHNRLFVAGAGTGDAYVYDAETGTLLKTFEFSNTFINDVVVTPTAAYFTDSNKALLYKVPIGPGGELGQFVEIPVGGDFVLGPGFNLNGIDATPSGHTLIAVQSNTGMLFRIDPASGVADEISLGGSAVPAGDGILLDGKRLYVVQNALNQVAVIELAPDLASGEVVTRLTDPAFATPTTIDAFGSRLYAVNARFGVTDPDAQYHVVQLAKPSG